MLAQVQQNQEDLPAAVAANQNAGTDQAVQNLAAVSTLLHLSVTSKAAAVATASASGTSTDSSNNKSSGKSSKHDHHRDNKVRRWAKRNMVVDEEKL